MREALSGIARQTCSNVRASRLAFDLARIRGLYDADCKN